MIGVFPLIYLAAVAAIGLSHRRSISTESDFFLARRSGGLLLVTGSLLATTFGSFGVMGISGLAYRFGFVGGWYTWVGVIGLLILGGWALRRIQFGDVFTLPEFLGKYYGLPVRQISAALIVIAWLSIVAAQLIAAGKILHFMGGASGWWDSVHSPAILTAVVALVFVVYTCLGGQHSVLRTDLIQAAAIFIGLIALIGGTLQAAPGILQRLEGTHVQFPFNPTIGPKQWLILVLTFGVPFLVGPDIYSRIFSGKSQETGRRAILIAALFMIPVIFLIVLAGVLGYAFLGSDLADPETVLFELSLHTVSPIWTGLLVAALLAAVMSSADTCLLTISTLVSRDLCDTLAPHWRKEMWILWRSRLIVALAGAASLLVALWLKDIVAALFMCYKLYSPAVLAPFLALAIFPGRRFAPVTGAAAVLTGGGCAGLGIYLGLEWMQLLAFALSAVPIVLEVTLRRVR